MSESTFHFAFKVKDIESTQYFYHTILGCELGRQTNHWIDFNFFGHQLSAHVSENLPELDYCGTVESLKVPIPHFGCLLSKINFDRVKERLQKHNVHFIVQPQTRYQGKKGEQQTMFVLDPSSNPIEFKSFTNDEEVFE